MKEPNRMTYYWNYLFNEGLEFDSILFIDKPNLGKLMEEHIYSESGTVSGLKGKYRLGRNTPAEIKILLPV